MKYSTVKKARQITISSMSYIYINNITRACAYAYRII
nr:MAG TPA: hypothetical protein [Bacteriophage sp.]